MHHDFQEAVNKGQLEKVFEALTTPIGGRLEYGKVPDISESFFRFLTPASINGHCNHGGGEGQKIHYGSRTEVEMRI
jgi:hypothetical protein